MNLRKANEATKKRSRQSFIVDQDFDSEADGEFCPQDEIFEDDYVLDSELPLKKKTRIVDYPKDVPLLESFSAFVHQQISSKRVNEQILEIGRKMLLDFKSDEARERAKEYYRTLKNFYDSHKVYCPICDTQIQQRGFNGHVATETHQKNLKRKRLLKKIEDNVLDDEYIDFTIHVNGMPVDDDADFNDGAVIDVVANIEPIFDEYGDLIGDHINQIEELNVQSLGEPIFELDDDVLQIEVGGQLHLDDTTRLMSRFFAEHRGRPLSEEIFGAFLRLLNHPSTVKGVAPTMYYLKKSAESFCSTLVPEELHLVGGGSLYHFPISHVLSLVLGSKKLTQHWKYTLPELGESAMVYQSRLPVGRRLLLVSLFFDEYQKSLGSKTLIDAVVMRIENLSIPVHFVLALLEPNIDKFQYVRQALIPCLRTLEDGTFQSRFYPSGDLEYWFGGLNMVLGDHMGQVELSGIPGPTAKSKIDRYLSIKAEEISQVRSQAQINNCMRNPSLTFKFVQKANVENQFPGGGGRAKDYLETVGLTQISPFWELRLFRLNFFQRFGTCRLHLMPLGHCCFVLSNLGLVLGWGWCEFMNGFIQTTKKQTSSLNLPSKLFYLASSKDRKKLSRISILRLTGGEVLAIMKVITEETVLSSVSTLAQKHLLLALAKLVFATLDMTALDGPIYDIVVYYKKLLITVFAEAEPKEPEHLCRDWNGFNLNFPKLSTLDSLDSQEKFCPLKFADTSKFEQGHGNLRKAQGSTNGKLHCRDILVIMQNKVNAKFFQHFESEEAEQTHHRVYDEIVNGCFPKKVRNEQLIQVQKLGEIRHDLDILNEITEAAKSQYQFNPTYETIRNFKGLKVNGRIGRKGDFIQIQKANVRDSNIWQDLVLRIDKMCLLGDHIWIRGTEGLRRK